MIKIYGSPRTSASRCFLLLEELEVPYEEISVDLATGQQKEAAYLQINPNGKVPAMIDGENILWESCAINNYLAEKYRPELLGADAFEKAKGQQWNYWNMLELQNPLVEILIQKLFMPDHKRNTNLIEKNLEKLPRLFQILDDNFANNRYLTGNNLNVADFNLTTAVHMTSMLGIDISKYTHLSKWFAAMKDTKGYQKLMTKRK